MPQPYVIDDPWCRHIPLLHRILAGAAPPQEFPAPARADRLEDACAVWETLHYLLRFLLGWEDPVGIVRVVIEVFPLGVLAAVHLECCGS